MGKAELLTELRLLTKSVELDDREFWQAPHFTPGIAKGILVELIGNACSEWLLELFRLHPEHFILWCDKTPKLNAVAVEQRGVKLSRIKFITSEKDLQQPLRIAFEGGKFYPFIIAPTFTSDIKSLRRFQLLAQQSKSTLFLIADKTLSHAWPISLQLEINFSKESFEVITHRQKYGAQT